MVDIHDTMNEIGRAYDCWRRWHNPMSRRWYREAVMEYRLACIVSTVTQPQYLSALYFEDHMPKRFS